MPATKSTTLTNMILFGATVAKVGGGFCGSYGLKAFRQALAAGSFTLPVIKSFLTVESLEKQPGWEPTTFQGGKPKQTFVFEQHYLHHQVPQSVDYTYLDVDMRTACDNYYTALAANPFMTFNGTPAYHTVAKVSEQIMPFEWFDKTYYEIIFRIEVGIYTT